MAFNAHYANIIGALFLATGQDAAHVVEGSLGITTAEDHDGDLYFSVNMPDLPVATIGGGTRLETASEGLSILGVKGAGNVNKFAEIVVSAVLAGELSLQQAIWQRLTRSLEDKFHFVKQSLTRDQKYFQYTSKGFKNIGK